MVETRYNLPALLITSDPGRLGGEACFTGTRVPVKALFDHLVAGDPLEVFLEDFPSVSREHAQAVLRLSLEAALDGRPGNSAAE